MTFTHEALNLTAEKPVVYTAASKHYFYFRQHITKFVLEQNKIPLNPFMIFDYFLLDTVDRDLVRSGNNTLIKKADELWVFGPVANGVLAEIKIAEALHKPIKYFKIENNQKIIPITAPEVEMEEEVKEFKKELPAS